MDAASIAADLIGQLGSPADAIDWLEDRLCNDAFDAGRVCEVINAVEALYRGHLH